MRDTISPILKNYPRIVSARVISVTDRLAVVRMPYAEDDSNDFNAYIITAQLVSAGDVVNVAYWSNLSTAVVLSNTSTIAAPSGGDAGNYNMLENKPSINSVTLTGNKTPSALGLYGTGNEPPYPVLSVNSKTGAVSLTAYDVGALSSDTVVPTKTSELTNDSGFLTSGNTINGKSIASNPVLTASDVGALSDKTTIPSKTSQLTNDSDFVTSSATVNGKSIGSNPVLTASDVGALPNTTTIPSKTSQLTNDSGYLTGVNTINGKSLADNPSLTATDVGALPDTTSIPEKTSQLTNDSGFLTGLNTVNGKSLADNPVLSASDVDALPSNTTYVSYGSQTLTNAQKTQVRTNIGAGTSNFNGSYNNLSDKPTIPSSTSQLTNDSGFVTGENTVNGKSIADNPVLTATDVGALPNTTTIPTKTSQLTNDSGYLTSVPVESVNGKTGKVVLSSSDVGALPQSTTYVSYGEQTLSNTQKAQVRTNIGVDNVKNIYGEAAGGITVIDTAEEDGTSYEIVAELSAKADNIAELADDGIYVPERVEYVLMAMRETRTITTSNSFASTLTSIRNGLDIYVKLSYVTSSVYDIYQFSSYTSNVIEFSKADSDGTIETIVWNSDGTITRSYFDAVPNTCTINGKALSANITLTAKDVGAGTSNFDGDYNSLTNRPEITQTLGSSADKIPSEKAVSDAIASAGGGDMLKSAYDADGVVANAGGIADYVKAFMPSGAIVMWSGAASAIPSGFVLCNGSNGTPNLVDKFVVGGSVSGTTGSFGKVEAGPQIEYYSLCYIMKT